MMEPLIVIRYYRPGDDSSARAILHEGTMSTVNPAFFSSLSREVTLQLIVILAATMFVFFGVPPTSCILSIPLTILIIYFCIYSAHATKSYGMMEDLNDIPRSYMSSQYTGFWVAEAYEPPFAPKTSFQKPLILSESTLSPSHLLPYSSHRRHIVGTIAIAANKMNASSAWLRRMSVTSRYRRMGVGRALLDQVIPFCREKGYESIELVTTECHAAAREMYLKRGFELRQLYHKQILGTVVQVLMYELTYSLTNTDFQSSLPVRLSNALVSGNMCMEDET